jgi:hypothetical protein
MSNYAFRTPPSSRPKYLAVRAKVRYWDAEIWDEGVLSLRQIPFRHAEHWCPVINIETGKILDWPAGVVANVCFKVCDCCECALLDCNHSIISKHSGYVINALRPDGDGDNDCIDMQIDLDGRIEDWNWSMGGWNAPSQ